MDYTLTLPEAISDEMLRHLFNGASVERAAYLLCRWASGQHELRLLAREVVPVAENEILDASAQHMQISSRSFLPAIKRAATTRQAFVFVHSHPGDVPGHSPQDDREERQLFRTAHIRADAAPVHGSLVLSSPVRPVGRVWLPDGAVARMSTIRVAGNRLHMHRQADAGQPNPQLFDRQVRGFGRELQSLLSGLCVGVVGAGGTGSAVCEQLARLGVGEILIADGQGLELSNVTRVYGSTAVDQGRAKVHVLSDHLQRIGIGTRVRGFPQDITHQEVLKEFRFCDLVFGCTDDEWGRALLNRLAVYYYVPVFDMGVKIDSHAGAIRSVNGRVTTLSAGTPCLFCRGRISADGVRAESISAVNPAEAGRLRQQGYAPELQEPAPAVIPFTTAVAASAVCEMLHRLSGFMGSERQSSEVLHLFDQTRTRTNSGRAEPECFCQNRSYWGRGDVEPFLDSIWRPE